MVVVVVMVVVGATSPSSISPASTVEGRLLVGAGGRAVDTEDVYVSIV